jgi:AraC family transcriptional activator of pobA
VPSFALYGERGQAGADLLHIEAVQTRSRLYDWEIDAHVHAGLYQVVCVTDGAARVSLDGAVREVRGPAVIAIPPGVVHAFRFAPDTDGQVLTFSARWLVEGDTEDAGAAFRSLFHEPRILILDPAAPATSRLQGLLDELAAEFRAPAGPDSPVTGWLARAVVWRLARIGESPQGGSGSAHRHHALFTRFRLLVEAHYLEHWPVTRYAQALNLTVERLNRLCRAQSGTRASALMHERLAREACRRLVYIVAPVSRIAFELGFDDPAYFCRFFKRHTGATPRAYRRARAAAA